MASAKEIRSNISSIKNTQKITKAMEMVAASKMRKAQDRMYAARPYAEKIRNVIAHLGHAHSEYHHPFLRVPKAVKNIGLIVITSDRGLCGGMNANLFRMVLKQLKQWEDAGQQAHLCLVGKKGIAYFSRIAVKVMGQVAHIGDSPKIEALIGGIKVALDAYLDGSIDALYIASNSFVNSMTQSPEIEQLIPVQRSVNESQDLSRYWDYIYEPDAQTVLDLLLKRYIESLVYQRVVENVASEQAARMVAMKSASDNAGKLIDELQLVYNKARQAVITQEISEIVSGAAAV